MALAKQTSAKKSSKGETRLRLWFFRFLSDGEFKVTIEGYIPEINADGEEFLRNWGSTAITKRIHSNQLQTASGTVYKLEGPIDEKEAKRIGLPVALIARFRNGFPTDWESILREYYDVLRSTNPLNASVWYEKTHGAGGSNGDRRASTSRKSAGFIDGQREESSNGDRRASSSRKSVGFVDEQNEEAAVRRRGNRLSVAPTVPAVIEENTLELQEGKDKENTPKNKALVGLLDSEGQGATRRSPRFTIVIDTPKGEVVGPKQNGGDKSFPMATLEVVETPRRGRPSKNPVQKPAKLLIEEEALVDDATPSRASKTEQKNVCMNAATGVTPVVPRVVKYKTSKDAYESPFQKRNTSVASSPAVNETPSKTPRGGRRPDVEKEPTPVPKSTPRRRSAKSPLREATPVPKSTPRRRSAGNSIREATPMPKSTPRRRSTASVAREATPAPTPKKATAKAESTVPPSKSEGKEDKTAAGEAPGNSAQVSLQAEKETKPQLSKLEEKPQVIVARSKGRPSKRSSSVAVVEQQVSMDLDPLPFPNPDDSLFKVPIFVPKSSKSVPSNGRKVVLVDWSIRFMEKMEGKMKGVAPHPPFVLTGQRKDYPKTCEEWATSLIKDVTDNACSSSAVAPIYTFLTVGESAYGIEGRINIEEMAIRGFSREFTRHFCNGFPEDWFDWIWEAYRNQKDRVSGAVGVPVEMKMRVVECGGEGVEPIVTLPNSDSESRASAPAASNLKRKKSQSMADISNLQVIPFDKRRLSSGSGGGELVKTSSRGRMLKERVHVRYSDRGELVGVENISIHEAMVDPFAEHYAFPGSSQNRRIAAKPPRLSIEMDGRKHVLPKKRLVEYTSSSSDASEDEVVMRTLRHIDYDNMHKARRPGAKRRRIGEEDSASEDEKRILARIDRKEKKAQMALMELRKTRLKLLNARERRKEAMWREAQMNLHGEDFDRHHAIEKKMRAQRQAQKHKYRFQQEQQQKKKRIGRPPLSVQKQKKRSMVVEEESSDEEDSIGFDGMEDETSDDVSEESSTTETEVSDGGEWERTPAQKKRAVKRTKKAAGRKKKSMEKRRKSSRKEEDEEEEESEEEVESDADIFEENAEPVVKEPKEQPKQKKPTWRQDDLDRLKLALKAMKVRSPEDWEKVAGSLGGKFAAAECHEMAVKKLKWEPPVEEPKEKAEIVVTARKGTQAYQVQADQQTRKFMFGGGSQEEDCFLNENTNKDSGDFEMPNVAEFDPDDSLVEVLKTPTVTVAAGRKGASRKPFIPAPIFGDDDTPLRTTRRSSTAIGLNSDEPGSADRENRQRYLHHLMQQDKSRLNNTTRMNNTSMFMNTTAVDRSRAVDNFSKKLDKIQKAAKQQTKKKDREFDEEDEEEEQS